MEHKFKEGKRVTVVSGKEEGRSGVITECAGSTYPEYHVILDGEDKERIYSDRDLECENIMDMDVDDTYLAEMAGRLPRDKSGRCKLVIAVGADERNIAHFHVFRSEKDLRAWKNGACLFFTENRYYDHSNNVETLTKDELKELSSILKAQYKHYGITNWQHLVGLWNDNNDRYEIHEDTPMPDYN